MTTGNNLPAPDSHFLEQVRAELSRVNGTIYNADSVVKMLTGDLKLAEVSLEKLLTERNLLYCYLQSQGQQWIDGLDRPTKECH